MPKMSSQLCKRQHADARVINSRRVRGGRYRRYLCRVCSARWTIYELPFDVKKLLAETRQLRMLLGELSERLEAIEAVAECSQHHH